MMLPTQGKNHGTETVTQYDPGRLAISAEAPVRSTPTVVVGVNNSKCQDYKPTALRWWFQLVLVVCFATLIGVTEYAIRILDVYEINEIPQSGSIDSRHVAGISPDVWEHEVAFLSRYRGRLGPREDANNSTALITTLTTTSTRASIHTAATGEDTTATSVEQTTIDVSASSLTVAPVSSISYTSVVQTSSHDHGSTTPSETSTPMSSSKGVDTNLVSSSTDAGGTTTTSPTATTSPKIITIPDSYLVPDQTTITKTTADSAYLDDGLTTITVVTTGTSEYAWTATMELSTDPSTYLVGGQTTATVTKASTPDVDLKTVNSAPPQQEILTSTTADTTGYIVGGQTIITDVKIVTSPDPTSAGDKDQPTYNPEPLSDASITVVVVQQTTTGPSRVVTAERTITDTDGHITVETFQSTVRGETSVLDSVVQSTLQLSYGEIRVAQPSVVETTVGGSTQLAYTTLTDSHGVHTASYETVIGGTPTSWTVAVVFATSIPSGYDLATFQEVATVGGSTEILETTFTDAQGHVTSSSFTTVIGGTPSTYWTVLATSAPSGEMLVTVPTVMPMTEGGATETLETTFTDPQGHVHTSSYTIVVGGTPTSTTLWTVVPSARPTATPTGSGDSNDSSNSGSSSVVSVTVLGVTWKQYVLGTFLPTIIAVLVSFPIKFISINARLMQPFHALATADAMHGSLPETSIFLRFYSWSAAFSWARAIRTGQPIIAISDTLVLGAGLLAPIAAEAISMNVANPSCQPRCYGSLNVSPVPGRVLEGLMGAMVACLIALIVLLSIRKWRTGVSQNPWSIAGMAALCLDPELRKVLKAIPRGLAGGVDDSTVAKALSENRYAIGDISKSSERERKSIGYGVIVARDANAEKQLLDEDDSRPSPRGEPLVPVKGGSQPFALLTWWGRLLVLFVFSSVLVILVYYENSSLDSGFERFMDGQSFGVRFFFTALGVVLGYCMETMFRCVAVISLYLKLSQGALPAERSILLSPATNPFYGMWSAFRQRHVFLGALSFATLIAELGLPVTLSHVPFSRVETAQTQLVCAWLSIAILAVMILTVASSFLVRFPHLPVDPRTIAGSMYYVCDSWMLETMEGLSCLAKKDRDLHVRSMRYSYGYGYAEGMSGKGRVGVDLVEEKGEGAAMFDKKGR